jgi:hypothetical protein
MYQGMLGRPLTHPESCQVRKVASLLAEALSRPLVAAGAYQAAFRQSIKPGKITYLPSSILTRLRASTSAASTVAYAASRRCLRVAYSGPVSQALGGATGD